jgi:hypothetical protein
VHGLTGGRKSTWTDKRTGTFWPKDLLKRDIPNARIITFGYDSKVVKFRSVSQNRVADHGRDLLIGLSRLRQKSRNVSDGRVDLDNLLSK